MKNVTRNLTENCVMARILRDGVRHQKNFSITQYKTVESAEEAAAKWVESQKKKLPPEKPRQERMTKANTSGVVGVFSHTHIVHKETHSLTYYRWIARWHKCPRRGGVAWYVNDENTDDDAFVLANLALKLRSVDRDEIRAAFRRAKKNGEYERIVSTKLHDAVPSRLTGKK